MASLTNTKIKNTYVSLLKVADNGQLDAALQDITDGAGNVSGIQLNTGGDLTASGTISFGSLKDSGENITITKFVDAADGIGSNDNDTTIPTSAAVKLYVDTNITAQDLDFTTDSGTGAVDLDSQTFSILGTANEIETSGTGQTVTIGLPSSITVDVTGNLTGNVSGNVTGNVTGNLSGNVTGNVTGDLTGNVTATSVLVDGVTATTQSIGDNSTKVATTAYVDAAITAEGLDFAGDSGTGTIDLDSEVFTIAGTANEIETSATGNSLIVGLPSNVTIGNNLTVTNDLAVDTDTLFVDASADRVGINKAVPAVALDVVGDITSSGTVTGSTVSATTLTGTLSTAAQTNITSVGTLSSLAVSGNLTVDTNTLFVDAANNRISIGTTSPFSDSLLQAQTNSDSGVYNYFINQSDGSSAASFIDVVGGSGADLRIGAYGSGHSTLANQATIFNHKLTGSLLFGTEGTEKMRIGSNGFVGIGTTTLNTISGTDPTLTLGGSSISGGLILQTAGTDKGRLYESGNLIVHQGMSSVGHSFYVNAATEALRIDTSGNVGIGTIPAVWRTTGETKALQISTRSAIWESSDNVFISNNLYFDTSAAFKYIETNPAAHFNIDPNGNFIFSNAGSGTAGTTPTLTERMRILSSGGITFNGDTAAANALDDYEEGFWDMTVVPETSGTITLNTLANRGAYTKIGRQVTVTGLAEVSSVGSPVGNFVIFSTLPFAVGARFVDYETRIGGGVTINGTSAGDLQSAAALTSSEGNTTFAVKLDASTIQGNTQFYFSFTYFA